MIDAGPKFYTVLSLYMYMTLRIFMIKFLGPHYFQTLFMFGVMKDTGPKFYAVP